VRRELQLALLLVLAGSALLLLGAGRAWVDLALPQPPPLPPSNEVRTGSDLVGGLSPLGLVGLAGVAALAATRGRGRVAVGVLLVVTAVVAAVATLRTVSRGALPALATDRPGLQVVTNEPLGFTAWPWVVVAGAVLLGLGGLLVAVRGQHWAALSARYEPPAARAQRPARPEVEAWEALDRGEDPTAGEAPDGDPHEPRPGPGGPSLGA
jgi:uncharacterized membrane protein (TIGR02234 family)